MLKSEYLDLTAAVLARSKGIPELTPIMISSMRPKEIKEQKKGVQGH